MRYKITLPIIYCLSIVATGKGFASMNDNEEGWGVGIGVRSATMPFKTNGNTVNDVTPLLFYKGENLYLDGTSGGYNLYQSDDFSFGLLASLRFFDIPRYAQNTFQGTQLDVGAKATWHHSPSIDLSVELLSDNDGRLYSNLTTDYMFEGKDWQATFYASLRAKSARFNDTYYGLQMEDIGWAIDSKAGVKGRKQIYRNLYAVGHIGATLFDDETYSSQAIDSHTQWEGYLGLAMFGSSTQHASTSLPEGAYIRLASGLATESGPTEIFTLNNDNDPDRNRMSSVFYGYPLSGSVFDLPIEFYLTPGYVYHQNSDTQDPFDEYVIAIKAYYTLDWAVRTRVGFAEGVSYSTKISHIENKNLEEKGYQASKLMNYLDFSIDANIGDIFNNKSLSNLWLGYSLHHRSGIFTTTSAFGRIKGGSDYNSLYLQWHF
ncbi:conserved exported hypothetical protein [Vibrio coralliirubri]|uniref:MipA/OmpV family protein n=1 Tax=Vibrio coralliirubri TaxID=1516159 RepID=UPI000631EE55|nr:MipA/OmpV family protein [Vibrio coralliirubri]CDT79933.1 conserved exported hypothetical protein [Vibrio coralliirubri]CDT83109.1 conserved exported hypothetical protein [Vibrio coralliirubri]